MGEVIHLNRAEVGIAIPVEPQPTDLQLAIYSAERASELFHALNLLSAHAGHVISHMAEMLRDDPRVKTPEWETKFHEYTKVWLRAQETLIPGVTRP